MHPDLLADTARSLAGQHHRRPALVVLELPAHGRDLPPPAVQRRRLDAGYIAGSGIRPAPQSAVTGSTSGDKAAARADALVIRFR